MLGYFLTWMQERKSEGLVVTTANNISSLPPEFLRSGRYDAIFYTDLPNKDEIKEIVKIMNRKYKSNIPENDDFYSQLEEEGWLGAEIEQLAKDSHFDDLETAMNNIPLLSDFRKDEIDEIRKNTKQYRSASSKVKTIERKKPITKKTLQVKQTSRLSSLN